MVKIEHHRTTWGIDEGPNFDNWAKWFLELKAHGYSKLETRLNHLRFFQLLRILQVASRSTPITFLRAASRVCDRFWTMQDSSLVCCSYQLAKSSEFC